jgi:uncharacterized protein (TIGR02145 family)
MLSNILKILLILLILVQMFSCTSVEFNNPTDPRINRGANEQSSSSLEEVQSSSSEVEAYSSSLADQSSSSEIPSLEESSSSLETALSSSSEIALSSSSAEIPSSSSATPSSSSVIASSSSVITNSSSSVPSSSSSSVAASSSSVASSSSSVTPSSSSAAASSSSSICESGASGTFKDDRDGNTYKWVKICDQVWMAKNLNYAESGSKCYGNVEANCDKYGRLYDWATAMNLLSSCNSSNCSGQVSSKHQGICPSGWHIPSDAEWDALMTAVGGSSTAGTKLKATSDWYNDGNGMDDFGFAALPGGYGLSVGNFNYVGNFGGWWSSTEYGTSDAYRRYIFYNYEGVGRDYDGKGSVLFSVRCLQD